MENRTLKTVSYKDAKGNTKTFKTLCTNEDVQRGYVRIFVDLCIIID